MLATTDISNTMIVSLVLPYLVQEVSDHKRLVPFMVFSRVHNKCTATVIDGLKAGLT